MTKLQRKNPQNNMLARRASDRVTNWIRSDADSIRNDDETESFERMTLADDDGVDPNLDALNSDFEKREMPSEFWDDVALRGLYPEDTSQWLSRLERGVDEEVRTTFKRGKPTDFDDHAPKPSVGLVYLPGADKPTVARLEESNMVELEPEQRDSTWRMNAASSLLIARSINRDLSFIHEDMTWKVIEACQRRGYMQAFPGNNRDTVTIDSKNVKIVNELRHPDGQMKYDLSATFVEVDEGSLVRLIQHFHHLVARKSPQMDGNDDKFQLENMMEDARFFCVRSPILFRMSTRLRIIESADIRYGLDDEYGFRNIYTSRGIWQLISVSAAYFNSLAPDGVHAKESAQDAVRPRFLQMLVLLLSMLAGADLRKMADFLQTTYGIKADRPDLELLILKVIPLSSINSHVFLSALIPAVTGREVDPGTIKNQDYSWQELIKHLASRGYLLPGTIDDLRSGQHSWIMQWPKNRGFFSSKVFGRLQCHGPSLEGFNELVPVNIGAGPDMTETTVYLHNITHPYIIYGRDLEQIRCLDEGSFMMHEVTEEARECELVITSQSLNDYANAAISLINKVIARMNAHGPRISSNALSRRFSMRGRHSTPMIIHQELPKANAITRHEAWLEGTTPALSVAWKCDGRPIPRRYMLQCLSRPVRRIKAVVHWFERMTNRQFSAQDDQYRQVLHLISKHEAVIAQQRLTPATPDNPIRRSVHQNDDTFGVRPGLWYEYYSRFEHNHLFINAQRDFVKTVTWISNGTQAEIELARIPTKFIVAPLKPEMHQTQESRDEEVQQADLVLLLGRYLLVAAVADTPPSDISNDEQMYEAMNWLEIQSVDEKATRRRDRGKQSAQRPLSVFV
ncbi:hypothetical protein PRZ48_011557 [Zasmidium cellare]|uniref:Uncharacterized protein n=1 Tax=Zasmidium cellare TaxID=395010 RepID=A0ABR0E6Q0_ZASCE|nr:hypothetical protein PRZ48_011557 [Zasmidium cellare]